ncbi:RHS repeat protein [Vibrio sp. S9_S30]|uniref:RHS repeat-associated core domain-containing protein n=1 Tax=Vibrio sp. S9_S30 TaxID=2720226 RepID=UPI00167FE5E2|nr:RHS repeat-associated core domain-containing protein [Vibrio sp. S9_S30]MBD1559843.1 RHS repeat protein [Vibrio sp. S9_S30]
MARKPRYAPIVKKIKEMVELVKVDAKDNIGTLNKVTQHGNGKFNGQAKVNQSVDGKTVQNATSEKRQAKQSTHITTNDKRTVENNASKNGNGDATQSNQKTNTEGCPVSMVTGEELLELQDVTLPGALPFTFTRTYKTSSCDLNTGLGFGWSHPLSQSLVFESGKLFWLDAENKRTELPEPTTQLPEIYNDLAGAAVFLGQEDGEYILAQAGSPFYHFKRQGNSARLSTLSDQYGNRLTVRYDGYQRPEAVVNEHGIALWFVYKHDLIAQIDFRTLTKGDTTGKWFTEKTCATYQYNTSGQLIAQRNTGGEGEDYAYDAQHVITLRKMAGGVEFGWEWGGSGKSVRCLRHWSNTGYNTQFDWDDESNAVVVTYSDGSTAAYQHDENAKLVQTTDPDGAVTKNEYNDNGDLVLTVDAMGNETKHVYNEQNQKVLTIAPDGATTEFQYWRGNLRKVIQSDRSWRYKYNEFGDITEKRDPLGQDTFYRYNQYGQLDQIRYPDGSQHKLAWNRLGMLIGETYPDGSEATYRYDIFGRIVLEKSVTGAMTRYEWDSADRLARIVLPGGKSKSFEYNGYGKPTKVVDENGHVTRFDYHPHTDLVSRVTQPDGSSLQYDYNNAKNFVSTITNERGESYFIDYYPNGLVQRETTFDGRFFEYEYDLNGKLVKETETGTQGTRLETLFERDVMGRLTRKVLPDGNEVTYAYDEYGQLTHVNDGDTPLAWQYDALGRLTQEHQGWASHYYQYDELSNLAHWQLPDANTLRYERSAGGVLSRIMLNEEQLTRHHFDNGLETSRQQGSLTSRFQHDEEGRLIAHTHHQRGQLTQSKQYQYSADGNLAEMADSRYGKVHYDYDPLSRLSATKGVVEETFAHDPAGNLLQQTLGGRFEEVESGVQGNQLQFHGDAHYEYDEFGRLIAERRGKGQALVTTYEYDCQHRLTQATLPDGTIATYQYDAFGRRIAKSVTDKLGKQTNTEFVWQGDNLIAETSDSHYQTYVYEPGSFKPLALISGEGEHTEVYHYQLDQIGTPTDLTDSSGNSVWSVQYRAYGNVLYQHVEEIANPLRFQGQYYDSETGLHYNRHRYYSPSTGRFTTADPIGLAGGLNNYQYVPNPTGWVDPLGLAVEKAVGACCGTTQKPDFYVGPDGPSSTLPSTAYRYMDSSFANQTMESMQAPLSYFGFTNFNSGKKARDAFQIYYDKNDPLNSWSDARLKGEFDTLQLYDSTGEPQVRVPMEAGDHGKIPEPFTRYYPEYGNGGERQLIPIDMSNKPIIKFRTLKTIGE